MFEGHFWQVLKQHSKAFCKAKLRTQSVKKINGKLYYETFKINSKTYIRNYSKKNTESFYRIPVTLWLRVITNCGRKRDLAKFLERPTANVKVATESSDTVESERRKTKQCWIKYILKKQKNPPVYKLSQQCQGAG
jgi:hypothetical protein